MLLSLVLSLLATTQPNVATQDAAVVYGDDTRQDLDALDDRSFAARVATSSAAQIPLAMIHIDEGTGALRFGNRRLGEAYGLCEDEAFYDQLAIATCSGTLIAPNLLLTAGHCVDTEARCADRGWLLGYDRGVSDASTQLYSEQLYTCRAVHALRFEREYDLDWDFAIVELDRPVQAPYGPAVLAASTEERTPQEALFVVSYPSGLPLKVDLDAHVIHVRNTERDYFTLMADTFSGSSGGGIFSATSGELVGVLVRSSGDYVNDPAANCRRVLQKDEPGPMSGYYESGSYAGTAIEAFCATIFGLAQPLCDAPLPPDEPTLPPPAIWDSAFSVGGGGGCQSSGVAVGAARTGWVLVLAALLISHRSRRRRERRPARP